MVITDEERAMLADARRWVRFMWQQGHTIKLDALEYESVYNVLRGLDELNARISSEGQLARVGSRDAAVLDQAAEIIERIAIPPLPDVDGMDPGGNSATIRTVMSLEEAEERFGKVCGTCWRFQATGDHSQCQTK